MTVCGLIAAIVSLVLDVAQFWRNVSVLFPVCNLIAICILIEWCQKLLSWWRSKTPRDRLLQRLKTVQTFEQWEDTAFELDELLSMDLWYAGLVLSCFVPSITLLIQTE